MKLPTLSQMSKLAIIAIFLSLVTLPMWGSKADLTSMSNGYEDYSSEIGLRFGDKLREAQLESQPWVITHTPQLINHSKEQQAIVDYAWEVSHSKDFLLTLKAENGTFDPKRQSDYINKWGKREDSWGVCQLHRKWNAHIVDDPRFFSGVPWQIRKCWEKFSINPNLFMGYKKRFRETKHFIF